MTTFDRREEAFENMFAHDEEMQFKAEARRAKSLGAWVADKAGKTEAEREAYVNDLVAFTTLNGGDDALFRRVRPDVDAAVSDAALHERIATLMAEALLHVKTA